MKKRVALERLGNEVKLERKKRKLTQGELAEYAGVGINFVYSLEKGRDGLSLSKILDVLKVLGIQLRIEYGRDEIVR